MKGLGAAWVTVKGLFNLLHQQMSKRKNNMFSFGFSWIKKWLFSNVQNVDHIGKQL